MSGPTRGSVEGRVYLDLQNKARRDGRPNAELQQLYVLEGFLARLAGSPYRERFVLKGGVLLAAFGTRRPTRDVAFQALHVACETTTVRALVIEVAGLVLDDGLVFNTQGARAETIRDDDEYSGVRVTMTASLARAQVTFHIDVNVGDPVSPAPVLVSVPRLLGGDPLALSGYSLPMVHAEKLVTALQRDREHSLARLRRRVDTVRPPPRQRRRVPDRAPCRRRASARGAGPTCRCARRLRGPRARKVGGMATQTADARTTRAVQRPPSGRDHVRRPRFGRSSHGSQLEPNNSSMAAAHRGVDRHARL